MTIAIQVNAFLYRMVRKIVSAVVKVVQGKLSLDDILKLLESKNRGLAPEPAPTVDCTLFVLNMMKRRIGRASSVT